MVTSFYTRSIGVIGTLYSILLGFFILISAGVTIFTGGIEDGLFALVPLGVLALFAFGLLFLQFLISPFLMDLQLSWVYDMDWIHIDSLPKELANAMKLSLDKHDITLKKIGIIYDNMPNAFTYGHFKNNARIVFTEGILNLLDPQEQIAVVEHEIGHIHHYDFLFMTIAQAVPLLFYFTYITLRRIGATMGDSSRGTSSKGGNIAVIFFGTAVLAYLLYRLSGFAILLLSRYREHYADEFSAYETKNPHSLSTALVKISYGMVVADSETQNKLDSNDYDANQKRSIRRRSGFTNAIRTMGLADINVAKGLVMQAATKQEKITEEDVAIAASWDLTTPWAKFIELQSTHPLTGKRLKSLDNFAIDMGLEPKYPALGKIKPPESLWDEFLVDIFLLYLAPSLMFLLPILGGIISLVTLSNPIIGAGIGFIIAALIWSLRINIKYPRSIHEFDNLKNDPTTVVEALTSMKKDSYYEASPIRGKPIMIFGQVQGRGTPGYILSEDFMVRDNSGFIVVDYNSVIPFYNLIFGYRNVRDMMGENVYVVGWYHRSIRPYVTLFRVYRPNGKVYKNRWRGVNLILAFIWFLIGGFFLLNLPTL